VSDDVVEVADLIWEKTIEKGELPAVVMFYSTNCPYCRTVEPYFRQLSEEYKDIVVFARLNIESSLWTAERYGIRATPTFKFFCQGRPVREIVGAAYPALLKKMIDESLLHGQECARSSTLIDYDITGYG
jgi:thioredoxin 1